MGDAVVAQRLDDGVATDDFAIRFGRGVAVVGRFHVGGQYAPQGRQPSDELSGQFDGLVPVGFALLASGLFGCFEAQAGQDLLGQQGIEALYVDADVVCDSVVVYGGFPVEAWEKDGAAKLYDFMQDFSRREGVSVLMLME